MSKPDSEYIFLIKNLIANKAKLDQDYHWKQRDFENLIKLIYNETHIRLSLSTIKRIWKNDYSGTPHPSTLDALARFAGFENWYAFKVYSLNKNESNPHIPEAITINSVRDRKKLKWPFLIFPAVLIILITVLIIQPARKPEIYFIEKDIVYDTLPAEAVFFIKVKGKIKDSLYLIPNKRPLKKIPVEKNQREIRYEYNTPGLYTASLQYGNRKTDSAEVLVKTNNWIASVYSYNRMKGSSIEGYYYTEQILDNGLLNVTKKDLTERDIPIDGSLFTLYYFVTDPFNIDYDNFVLEMQIKSDSIYNYPNPYFYVSLITSNRMEYIPFTSRDIDKDYAINFSDSFLEGNTNDLSSLVTDVYSWNNIRIENTNKEVRILANGREAFKFMYKAPLNPVCGFNITFLGSGSVGDVKLFNEKGELVYKK